MASSDFDDIFGDLKEDEQFSPSLAGGADLDDASIFGDAPSAVMNMKPSVNKPTSNGSSAAAPAADQDEFLSWLDDGPPSTASSAPERASVPPPAPTSASTQRPPAMDTIDLGDGDDDDFLSASPPPRTSSYDEEPLDSPPSAAVAPINPMPASIPVHVSAPSHSTISLDDDDDDLEKIIEEAKAKARKSGSRESSNTSLQIKSQRNSSGQVSQFDAAVLIKEYNASGVISTPAARVAMWHHALCGSNSKETVSMYAVQTTPLDLPNQSVLRKDVEDVCTTVFSSTIHAESLRYSSTGGSSANDSAEGARLLFIDNAEILVTYLCKKLHLSEYPPGFAFTFGPAIAVAGNDPLRLDLVATLQAACHHVMPHLAKEIAPQQVAEARRGLLKWLLLYHAPSVAFHLDQHFHQWNTDAHTIPDSWLASMFESENNQCSFDALAKIWDCCALLDLSGSKLAATNAFPSTTACFVVMHVILKAEKKLLRMEGDQLKHCMAQTLVDTLKEKSDEPLLLSVRRLIDATPPSVCIKLRDAGIVAVASSTTATAPSEAGGAKATSKPFSLISASTNGVKQVGSMVIDMPTKLLTTMVPIKFTLGSSSAGAGAKDHSANEEFFTQLMSEATPSSSVCVTLAASEVIPQVFRSFQAPQVDEKIRYFIIDCRASEETKQGQIPTAFHFDPDAVTDPTVLETVLATLNPLKTTVHMCVMGHGYGHIADDLRQFLASQQSGGMSSSSELPFFLKDDFLESFARDISRANAAVLFLAKRGFPHVSVLEGGYAAAHSTLMYSGHEGYSVADLIDHDAPQCTLCQHRRASMSSSGSFTNRTESRSSRASVTGDVAGSGEDSSRTSNPPSRGSSAATLPQSGPKLSSSASGELDAKSLFDSHASPVGGANSYFSSFAGALKTGGKAMGMGMIPTASLKDSSKWLMGKKPSNSNPGSPVPGDAPSPVAAKSPLGSAGLPNLSKLKNSLSQLGSESLDMLKKAEQAATKTTQLKGMFGSSSSPNVKAAAATGFSSSASAASTPTGGGGSRNGSFQRAEEEVFTIDDDDEEEQDDFVGSGRGSSRTSSSSSMSGHRSDSFTTGSSSDAGGGGMSSTVVLHTVEKGKVKELTKGMRVSRTQMLPFVESPFFSAYKKKKPVASPTSPANAAAGRGSMLPRRLVVAENHIVVLKAERNMDDVYSVKSCHHLAHLGRMTCLKKNALMVTMYYKWKAPYSGEVLEKKNGYEVQQRDEFIKVIKNAMEKM